MATFNKIDLIVKYSTDMFDEVYKAESRSALLDGDKKLMQFTGAKTVKIMKFAFTGLSDYKRNNTSNTVVGIPGYQANGDQFNAASPLKDSGSSGFGYQAAAMGGEWEEFTIACDRGAQYRVEMFDNEETAQMAVGMGTNEINRTVIIPEVDAYCFAKLASYTNSLLGNLVTTDVGSTPVSALNNALLYFDNNEVPAEDQVIFCSPAFMNKIRNTSEVVKPLLQSDYTANKDIKFTIDKYEGRPIVVVPPSRFQTAIELYQGGFRPASGAHTIDFLVASKKAVYHIVKYNKVKVFGPDVVQDYDGYKINARIYHDVFVPDNKRFGIYCHAYSSNTTAGITLSVGWNGTDDKITGIEVTPSGIFGTVKYALLANSTATAVIGQAAPTGANVHDATIGGVTVGASTHIEFFVQDIYGKVIAVVAPQAV